MKNNNSFSIIALGLSGVSLLVSVYIICSENRFNTDWYAIVVGILALLVTVLIGWNIYTVIDFRRETETVKDTIQYITKEFHEQSAGVMLPMMEFYMKKKNEIEPFYRYGLGLLIHQSIIEDITACNTTVKVLIECTPKDLTLRKIDKTRIVSLSHKIYHPEKITGFLHFRDLLLNAQVVD
ncbi:hypothetical protein LDB17_01495 [Dysgonomonas sp. Shenzhen-Wh21]|uniref:hypothetical protein n=1 Tax=Dysgonomonas TaxID=156973 RepID=UPI00208E10CB|nr:hypothetical protein [Dysgonomonas mossii]